jgi:mono/diheme cytochrome c family protein
MKKALSLSLAMTMMFMIAIIQPASGGVDPLLEKGRVLYNSNCRVCHINKSEGDRPTPYTLRFSPPDFADASFWKDNTEKEIADTVKHGKKSMPAFPGLTKEDMHALIYYLSHAFKQ